MTEAEITREAIRAAAILFSDTATTLHTAASKLRRLAGSAPASESSLLEDNVRRTIRLMRDRDILDFGPAARMLDDCLRRAGLTPELPGQEQR